MKDGKLEIGDVLYFESIDTIKRYEISKVLKRVAISAEGGKFEEETFHGAASMIAPHLFWRCHLETPELKAKFETKAMVNRIKNTVHKLNVDKLKRINDILDEK